MAGDEVACDGRSSQCVLDAPEILLGKRSSADCGLLGEKALIFFVATMCTVSVIMLNSTTAFTRSKIAD